MTLWLLVALIILATHRGTRLVIADTIPLVAWPRNLVLNWFEPDETWLTRHPTAKPHLGALGRTLAYLMTCPWCMSVWVGALIVWVIDHWFIGIPLPVLVVAAASSVTGLIADIEDRLSK